jgi:hypothetical protein
MNQLNKTGICEIRKQFFALQICNLFNAESSCGEARARLEANRMYTWGMNVYGCCRNASWLVIKLEPSGASIELLDIHHSGNFN